MLRVAICDDEAAEVKKIEGFIRAYDDFDISTYTSSAELARVIDGGVLFDLYLLDVVMPKPDGIELARLIREFDKTAAIIFLTSHDGRALDAFRVRASQYLTKPVDSEILRRELDTALTAVKVKNAKTFLLKTKDGTEALPFHRIVYCELVGRSLCLVTADGEKHMSVTLRAPFEEIISPLLADRRFFLSHTSFVVNMDYVQCVRNDSLDMRTGVSVPVARRFVSEAKDKYFRHFFGDWTDASNP